MEACYRIAFTQARCQEFSATLQKIHDSQRYAEWSSESSVFVSDDLVQLGAGDLVTLIYFPPTAAEMFADVIKESGGEPCLKPLPFGLEAHGNSTATRLLE
jgi:hypothetical protein